MSSFVSFHVQQLLFSLVINNETNGQSSICLTLKVTYGIQRFKAKMQHSGTLLQEGLKRTEIVSGKILYQGMLKIIIFAWAWLTLFKLDHCFLDYIFDFILFLLV